MNFLYSHIFAAQAINEELWQEMLLAEERERGKAFEKRPSFRRTTMIIGPADFESKPWLYAIIITICILGLHKEKGRLLTTFVKATQGGGEPF